MRDTPYESDPATRAWLDASCTWQREPLPSDQLASLTRYSSLPAGVTEGGVEVSAVVTVHTSREAAEQEFDGTLQESLNCSEQNLGGGERLTELLPLVSEKPLPGTEEMQAEVGKYHAADGSGPYYYHWWMFRLGPVSVAVTARCGTGYSEQELRAAELRSVARMLRRLQGELGIE